MTISNRLPRLLWISPFPLNSLLDAATWLTTTRELRHLGLDVILVCPGIQDGVQTIRGVEAFCIATPDIYFFKQLIFHHRLLQFLHRWREVDVILFHSMSMPWLLWLRFLRIFSSSKHPLLVMDTRTLTMQSKNTRRLKGYFRGWYMRFMDLLSIRWMDGQTAITGRMAKAVHIPPEKLWGVWPSGVDLNFFSASTVCRNWSADDEPIRLGYIGSLEYERNLLGLVAAVRRANAEGMSFQITMVGDGKQRQSLEEVAAHLPGIVEVRQTIPYNEIPVFLGSVHVGVLPFPDEQKFRVSSPIKLFEYMAAGLPILATRIACHTDVIQNGSFVFWAESSSDDALLHALCLLWQQRHKIKSMGTESVLAAQAWTWHASALKLKAAIEYGLKINTVH